MASDTVYWNKFYRKVSPKSRQSSFAEAVAKRIKPCLLFEFGCGDGLDALYFAAVGFTVSACDVSAQALASARRNQGDEGCVNPSFSTLDVSDAAAIENFLAARDLSYIKSPAVFYGRFFLHSITREDEKTFLKAIEKNASSGDFLCLEFRTEEDELLGKTFGGHYRRFIKFERLVTRLIQVGRYRICLIEKGRGLSLFRDEDPHLGRLILEYI